LKGRTGHELFKNLLREETIKLISLFGKQFVGGWKWKMGWVWVLFF
jgi:hypothetical protein